MQFSTLALATVAMATSVFATDIVVHVVTVGSMNGSITYSPNNLKAAVGDMVQFQFGPANHTVTQSTFDNPCSPIAQHSNITGIYSGFMPVAKDATTVPTYTIMIANKTPMWLYCSQGKHCQNGMVMVINENTAANSTRSLANYAAGAKLATANLAPAAGAGSAAPSGTTPGVSSSIQVGIGSEATPTPAPAPGGIAIDTSTPTTLATAPGGVATGTTPTSSGPAAVFTGAASRTEAMAWTGFLGLFAAVLL